MGTLGSIDRGVEHLGPRRPLVGGGVVLHDAAMAVDPLLAQQAEGSLRPGHGRPAHGAHHEVHIVHEEEVVQRGVLVSLGLALQVSHQHAHDLHSGGPQMGRSRLV